MNFTISNLALANQKWTCRYKIGIKNQLNTYVIGREHWWWRCFSFYETFIVAPIKTETEQRNRAAEYCRLNMNNYWWISENDLWLKTGAMWLFHQVLFAAAAGSRKRMHPDLVMWKVRPAQKSKNGKNVSVIWQTQWNNVRVEELQRPVAPPTRSGPYWSTLSLSLSLSL